MPSFELWLDESGNFTTDDADGNLSPSLVGGWLNQKGILTDKQAGRLIPEDYFHSVEDVNPARRLGILKDIKEAGCKLVVFSNEERLTIVNGDITYLNVLVAGMIQLIKKLTAENGPCKLYVTAAVRVNVEETAGLSQDRPIIGLDAYQTRLWERLILAREQATRTTGGAGWRLDDIAIELKSARRDKRLMLADIVCNTFLTRNAKKKFTNEQRDEISDLFQDANQFAVFEDATLGFVDGLIAQEKYGEAIFECCRSNNAEFKKRLTKIAEHIARFTARKRGLHLGYVESQIKLLIHDMGSEQIEQLPINYRDTFLPSLAACGVPVGQMLFDVDFLLAFYYSRMGNVVEETRYIEGCNKIMPTLRNGWEWLSTFYTFKIREAWCFINKDDFYGAEAILTQIIDTQNETKMMFEMLSGISESLGEIRSDLLGKAHAARCTVFCNLARCNPVYIEKALADSGRTMQEFSKREDELRRHYLTRSMLEALAGNCAVSREFLFLAAGLERTETSFKTLLNALPRSDKNTPFLLRCYCYHMYYFFETEAYSRGMLNVLLAHEIYNVIILTDEITHPVERIQWLVASCLVRAGKQKSGFEMFRIVNKHCFSNPKNQAVFSCGIAILAEMCALEIRCNAGKEKTALKELRKRLAQWQKFNIPDSMKKAHMQICALPFDKADSTLSRALEMHAQRHIPV